MAKSDLTAERLRELLDYDPQTGVFRWRQTRMCGRYHKQLATVAGEVAGAKPGRDGYRRLCIDYRVYPEHRLAWMHVHGRMPTGQIDHKNGVRTDNRIENLREVSNQTNSENRRTPNPGNRSGLLGVTAARGKFYARLFVRGKKHFLGTFETPEEAHAAYVNAKRELHEGCTI